MAVFSVCCFDRTNTKVKQSSSCMFYQRVKLSNPVR